MYFSLLMTNKKIQNLLNECKVVFLFGFFFPNYAYATSFVIFRNILFALSKDNIHLLIAWINDLVMLDHWSSYIRKNVKAMFIIVGISLLANVWLKSMISTCATNPWWASHHAYINRFKIHIKFNNLSIHCQLITQHIKVNFSVLVNTKSYKTWLSIIHLCAQHKSMHCLLFLWVHCYTTKLKWGNFVYF